MSNPPNGAAWVFVDVFLLVSMFLLITSRGTGSLEISLGWSNYNDLDLSVVTVGGETVDFSNKHSKCGGVLDGGMNGAPQALTPVNNIIWPIATTPRLLIKVYVTHYKNHGEAECQDPSEFVVRIKQGESIHLFRRSVIHADAAHKKVLVTEVDQ